MLPPYELKNGIKFSKGFHGYATAEVDEQIAFIMEQYTELYRENDELEKKLNIALAQIDSFKGDEQSIQTALVNAQKASASIVKNAKKYAADLEAAANASCRKKIEETAEKIRQEYRILAYLEKRTGDFKKTVLSRLADELEAVHALPAESSSAQELEKSDAELLRELLGALKEEASVMRKAEAIPLMKQEEPELPEELLSVIPEEEDASEELPEEEPGTADVPEDEPEDEAETTGTEE